MFCFVFWRRRGFEEARDDGRDVWDEEVTMEMVVQLELRIELWGGVDLDLEHRPVLKSGKGANIPDIPLTSQLQIPYVSTPEGKYMTLRPLPHGRIREGLLWASTLDSEAKDTQTMALML